MADRKLFNVVPGQKCVEITPPACDSNRVTQHPLGASKVDSRVDMSVQSVRMVEKMKNAHADTGSAKPED